MSSGLEAELLNWAKPLRLATAPGLTRAYVMAVPPTVCRLHVRKGRAVTYVVNVDAIANARAELYWIGQNTGHDTGGNVYHVVVEPAPVREAGVVTRQEPQALLTAGSRGRNAGVQSEQIGNWAGVLGAASRTDRGRVLDQGQ